MLFYTRDLERSGALKRAAAVLKTCQRSNVVSHSTYASPRRARVGVIYGRRQKTELSNTAALARVSQIKAGARTVHFRLSGYPPERNDGKMLIFRSGNMIRAGKHSHADALRCLFATNQYIRRLCKLPHVWHTGIDHPNMVLSGKLHRPPGEGFKSHYLCTSSPKFPGVAVKTGAGTTPEVYCKSGTYIIPGTTTIASFDAAVSAMAEALGAQPAGDGPRAPGAVPGAGGVPVSRGDQRDARVHDHAPGQAARPAGAGGGAGGGAPA